MKVKNITLLGHKDHGKSTLIGNLMILTKSVTETRINEAKKTSEELGRKFEPGYILDSFEEERKNEMTIDTTRAEMVHKDLAFAFIDVPGHEELIKNMISGASYAEIALLIVSAKKDEGIKDQTKRHIFIARMLGIEKLVVAVNKMDLISYDKEKFDEITKELQVFIEKIGFPSKNIYFVPISAYNGDNMIKKSANIKWYKGKPLVDLLYINAKIADKNKQKAPLRILAQGFIDSTQETAVGKVISGTVKVGSEITLLPLGDKQKVNSIAVKGKNVKSATVNDDIAIRFGKPLEYNVRGMVIAGRDEKPLLTNSLESTIFVTGPIKKNLMIKVNGSDVICKELKIKMHIDTTNGNTNGAKKAETLNAIRATLSLEKKIPVEKFAQVQELGRFVLYSDRKFAGIGIVI